MIFVCFSLPFNKLVLVDEDDHCTYKSMENVLKAYQEDDLKEHRWNTSSL